MACISGLAVPDTTQWDGCSPYHDIRSSIDSLRWLQIDVKLMRKTRLLSLTEVRQQTALHTLQVLKRGNRLSITPVTAEEWAAVLSLLDPGPACAPGPGR